MNSKPFATLSGRKNSDNLDAGQAFIELNLHEGQEWVLHIPRLASRENVDYDFVNSKISVGGGEAKNVGRRQSHDQL